MEGSEVPEAGTADKVTEQAEEQPKEKYIFRSGQDRSSLFTPCHIRGQGVP